MKNWQPIRQDACHAAPSSDERSNLRLHPSEHHAPSTFTLAFICLPKLLVHKQSLYTCIPPFRSRAWQGSAIDRHHLQNRALGPARRCSPLKKPGCTLRRSCAVEEGAYVPHNAPPTVATMQALGSHIIASCLGLRVHFLGAGVTPLFRNLRSITACWPMIITLVGSSR